MALSYRPCALALALAFVLAAILATATRAGGYEIAIPPPPSRPVYANGAYTCHATAAPGGWYLGRHCLRFGPPRLSDGIARPYSGDAAGRDIAHILDRSVTTATLGTAAIGDALAWRSERTTGVAQLVRITTGNTAPGVWLIDQPGQVLWILCRVSGGPLLRGDSGTGLGNARGELAALFVGGDLDGQTGSAECGRSQRVFGVPVP